MSVETILRLTPAVLGSTVTQPPTPLKIRRPRGRHRPHLCADAYAPSELERRKQRLVQAYVYDQAIDRPTYDKELAALDESLTLANWNSRMPRWKTSTSNPL